METRPYWTRRLDWDVWLSLEELALRRVSVNLWSDDDVIREIQRFQCTTFPLNKMMIIWNEKVESVVQRKILNIGFPSKLEKKLTNLIKPMGTDILKWKIFNEHYLHDAKLHLTLPILKQLQWTNVGSVDYGKTAEKLVRCEMLSIVERYKIACFYCLVDDIPLLWEKLPEETKSSYTDKDLSLITDMKLEYYWPYILTNCEVELLHKRLLESEVPLYMWAFQAFACIGNLTAAEYFYQKLTKGRAHVCLYRSMKAILKSQESFKTSQRGVACPQGRLSDVSRYILSRLHTESQWHLLESFPRGVLSCFLEWPWQDLFLRLADTIWETFPSEENYRPMLGTISNPGFYQYYPYLFQNFFIRSPASFKKYFVTYEISLFQYFREFFHTGDAESIEVVFKNIEPMDKLKLIASVKFFNVFFNPARNDRWHLAELCLIESAYYAEHKELVKNCIEGVLVGDETTTFEDRKNALRRVLLLFFDVNADGVRIIRRGRIKELYEAKKKKE